MRDSQQRQPILFSGAVLAGGWSRRMGEDKALLKWGGEFLIERQLRCLRECGARECIVSGREAVDYSFLNARVVHDEKPDLGPLAGVAAVLKAASFPLVLLLAVDMPQMSVSMLRKILAACEDRRGCVPLHDKRFEPLAAVYPKSALSLAEHSVAEGRLSMQAFVKEAIGANVVSRLQVQASEEIYFTNCNEPGDWEIARSISDI